MNYGGKCPYWDCSNRNELGYCRMTACINPKYQSNTYSSSTSTSVETTRYRVYTSDSTEEDE